MAHVQWPVGRNLYRNVTVLARLFVHGFGFLATLNSHHLTAAVGGSSKCNWYLVLVVFHSVLHTPLCSRWYVLRYDTCMYFCRPGTSFVLHIAPQFRFFLFSALPLFASAYAPLSHYASPSFCMRSKGRLKCTGRTVHTKGRLFTLYADKAANRATRMDCRDVFDSLVFFSKACWVGKKEDNPDEEPLPLPESLQVWWHCRTTSTRARCKDDKKVTSTYLK